MYRSFLGDMHEICLHKSGFYFTRCRFHSVLDCIHQACEYALLFLCALSRFEAQHVVRVLNNIWAILALKFFLHFSTWWKQFFHYCWNLVVKREQKKVIQTQFSNVSTMGVQNVWPLGTSKKADIVKNLLCFKKVWWPIWKLYIFTINNFFV